MPVLLSLAVLVISYIRYHCSLELCLLYLFVALNSFFKRQAYNLFPATVIFADDQIYLTSLQYLIIRSV
jgi:hypothetical protein